jgi:hypothetical protein
MLSRLLVFPLEAERSSKMEKEQFITHLAKRTNVPSNAVETVVEATITETFSPAVFRRAGQEVAFFDNNCTNNCKAEQAVVQPGRPEVR